MATFEIKAKVWNPADPSRFVEVAALVDTGASYSWILRSRLEPLGVQTVRRLKFRTIEGHTIERDLASGFLVRGRLYRRRQCGDGRVRRR